MNGRAVYLDTSAFLKLVVSEPESRPLRQFVSRWPEQCSASLIRTEAVRALRRSGYENRVGIARRLMGGMRLIRVDDVLLDRAGELDPRALRSLDAIHVAAALELTADLGALVTYDQRLATAASTAGLRVEAPR
ncbi:MAG: type II toxin-antitoxin system VapC family toxin [Candidatus Dormibacteraeota bacterium]|nr:type II toxin-antitoxin system VapC family toxin [Candidatus Dormibacteraeota bacterium]